MSDNTLLIMTTAGVATIGGVISETLTVKYDPKTTKSKVSFGAPKMKPVIAGFFVGLFLFGMNAVSDEVTRAMCILIIVGTLILRGPAMLTAINVGGLQK